MQPLALLRSAAARALAADAAGGPSPVGIVVASGPWMSGSDQREDVVDDEGQSLMEAAGPTWPPPPGQPPSVQSEERLTAALRSLRWMRGLVLALLVVVGLSLLVLRRSSTVPGACVPPPMPTAAVALPTPPMAVPPPVPEPGECRQPWMLPTEIDLVRRTIAHVRATKAESSPGQPVRMLEYGSGASTFAYSLLVDEYYSIEHNLDFCAQLYSMASACGVPSDAVEVHRVVRSSTTNELICSPWNVTRARPPSPRIRVFCVAESPDSQRSRDQPFHDPTHPSTFADFEDYIRLPAYMAELRAGRPIAIATSARLLSTPSERVAAAALATPDGLSAARLFPASLSSASRLRFDLVLVDGRARPQCAWLAWSLLAEPIASARVLVHDWKRTAYQRTVRTIYDVVDEAVQQDPGIAAVRPKNETAGAMHSLPKWFL